MPGRERVTAYNHSAMKPLPSPRMGGKSDTLFAMTSPPVRRVLFDDKPKVNMKGDDFTEPLWREGPVTEEEKQALIDYMYNLWPKEIQTRYDQKFK